MQRRIQPLPVQLANQIAAGEVVERPASVVKELLENSIDAGATRIELELEQGGSRLIRVIDNGRGIHPEDLPLAISPHATSKIYSQKELEQIASLGFRGEALASIASVSRFRLASRFEDETQGWEFDSDADAAVPSPIPQGTMVEVRDLFYNTPARRKFLRTERTEYLHIEEVLRRLALSRFDIAFTLVNNGRKQLRLRSASNEGQRESRIADVLGRSFMQHALAFDFSAAALRLHGWLAGPDGSRAQADSQYFYLNGRMIRDKLISHALRQAHQEYLEPGRHPAYVLYLEVDPRQVDVNVHPTKHEVRFRESRMVHDFIVQALRNALAGEVAAALPATAPDGDGVAAELVKYGAHPRSLSGQRPGPARVAEQNQFYRQGLKPSTPRTQIEAHEIPARAESILHGRYLLAHRQGEPLLLDLAAARKVQLRRHLEQMLAGEGVRSQPLLIPQSVNLPAQALTALEQGREQLARLGFDIESLAENSVVVRYIPAMLRGVEVEALVPMLAEVLAEVAAQGGESVQGVAEPLLQLLLQQAVTARPLSDMVEAQRLLQEVLALPNAGREFWRTLEFSQLESLFQRGRLD